MCTFVILRRPKHPWPVIIGANRDEMKDRAWQPPARHWPDRPELTAGLDVLGDGTWLGLNDWGVVAGVLNRMGTLGPASGKRSRGELPLEALDHAEVREAAKALTELEPASYRPFNLVIADPIEAVLVICDGETVWHEDIPEGLSMITARGLNAADSPRTARYRPLFDAAMPPDPETDAWQEWADLLASTAFDQDAGPHGAMHITTDSGFETVSSSLIALPAHGRVGISPKWMFAAADGTFQPVV